MECRKSIRRSLRPWTRPFLGSLHWVTGGLPKPPRLETPGMMQSNCELHGSVVVVFQVCPGRKAFPDVILNAAESELNVLSTCVCLNIYSVLFYSLNLTFFHYCPQYPPVSDTPRYHIKLPQIDCISHWYPLIIFIYIPYNYCCGLSTIFQAFFSTPSN